MTTTHLTTSTDGSESCKTMGGGEGEGAAQGVPTVFAALRLGAEFLDLTYGSWWVKTDEQTASCNDLEDSAYSYCELAGFGLNEPVLEGVAA